MKLYAILHMPTDTLLCEWQFNDCSELSEIETTNIWVTDDKKHANKVRKNRIAEGAVMPQNGVYHTLKNSDLKVVEIEIKIIGEWNETCKTYR